MAFRIKVYLVSFLATLAMMATALCGSMALVTLSRSAQSGYSILMLLMWPVLGTLIFLGFFKLLKCPRCGTRFGLKNHFNWRFIQFLPSRECPNCGSDMFTSAGNGPTGPRS